MNNWKTGKRLNWLTGKLVNWIIGNREISQLTNYPVNKWAMVWMIWMVMAWVGEVDAGVSKIPLQYYRGWWYVRIPVGASETRLRISIPYDVPVPIHFHVMVLPEKNMETFTGNRQEWPKGWIWHEGVSPLIPLVHSQVVAEQKGLTLRVTPSVLAQSPPVSSVLWGDGPFPYEWLYTEVEGGFHYHPLVPPNAHGSLKEFRRGSRTPWLDLGGVLSGITPPAGASTWLVALAPYHHQLPDGDQALTCYPPKQGSSESVRDRTAADYPNDPGLLWGVHHEDQQGPWKNLMRLGTAEVFGAINFSARHAVQFTQAWVAGAFRLDQWSDRDAFFDVDVGIRRPSGTYIPRYLWLREGIVGQMAEASKFPASILDGYYKAFGIGMATSTNSHTGESGSAPVVTVSLGVTGLPALDTTPVQEWLGGAALNIPGLRQWAQNLEIQYLGSLVRLNEWLIRMGASYQFYGWPQLDFGGMLLFFYAELMADPPVQFKWAGANGILDLGILMNDFVWNWAVNPNPSGVYNSQWFSTTIPPVQQVALDSVFVDGSSAASHTSVSELRRPLAWAMLVPPLFNQIGALASPELINTAFAWWRASVNDLANPGLLQALQKDPDKFPYLAWYPVEPSIGYGGADGWAARYARMPWTRLLTQDAGYRRPYYTGGALDRAWRFEGTEFSWPDRLSDIQFWSPQPPALRASNNGNDFSTIVLPTAAYPMGPIEIKFIP